MSAVSILNKGRVWLSVLLLLVTGLLHAYNDSIQSNLTELDKVIESKSSFEEKKKQQIAVLKEQLTEATTIEDKYKLYNKLYNEYETYNYDSTYLYSQEMVSLGKEISPHKETEAKLLMAYCSVSAGLFYESDDIIRSIDSTKLEINQKIFLYSIYAKMNLDMANSVINEPYFSNYNKKSIEYSRAIIKLLGKDNPDAMPHWANIYRCRQNYRKAIEALDAYLQTKELDERSRTLCAGGLGQFYMQIGDTAKAISYLSYTAISDIQAVTKETPSLSLLAGIMYKQGDIKRAYKYARLALDDANFYNARHRKIEVGDVLPIIEASRYETIQNKKIHCLLIQSWYRYLLYRFLYLLL